MAKDSKITKFEELFREQYAPLSRYVYRMVGGSEDTLEIVQESFLRLWALGGNADDRNQAGLLFRLARNLVIDLLRRRAVREKHAQEVSDNVLVMPVNPEQAALGSERRRQAEAALRELEPKQRDVLRLRAQGFTYAEISRILGVNAESVGPTLTRALRRFRAAHDQVTQQNPGRGRHETAG